MSDDRDNSLESSKFWMIVGVTGLFLLLGCIILAALSMQYKQSVTCEGYYPYVDDVLYINVIDGDKIITLDELVNQEYIPSVVTAELEYKDGTKEIKQCYIVYNPDENVERIEFKNDKYGRIMLPAKYYKGGE